MRNRVGRSLVFVTVGLVAGLMSQSALAACDTATITGVCVDAYLPGGAGNVNYVVGAGTTISSSNSVPGGNAPALEIGSTIGSFTNSGTITGGGANTGLLVDGGAVINGDFINNGTIYSQDNEALLFGGTERVGGVTLNGNFVNNGRIEFFSDDQGTDRWGYPLIFSREMIFNGTFTNSATGVITSNSNHAVEVDTYISEFTNLGMISHTASDDNNWGPAVGMFGGHIGVFKNSGIMTDSSTPQFDYPSGALLLGSHWETPQPGSVIDTLINSGEMSVTNATYANSAITIRSGSSIGTITNTGDIWTARAGYYGIENKGSINTLNNFQGATGSYGSALTLRDNLPSYYNMIAYGDEYGQLSVADLSIESGSMMFGVFGGDSANGIAASRLKSGVYENVVMGAVQSDFSNEFDTSGLIITKFGFSGAAFGNYNGVAWMLTDATYREGDGLAWDLTTLNFGMDISEPQRAMLEQRQRAIRVGLDHDCAEFYTNNICVSLQARQSGFGDEVEGAGVLTVAKRIDTSLRFGGFIDARVASNEVDGIEMKTGLPMFGLFAAYSAGEDGTGLQARVSTAFESGIADITRDNLVGSAASVTEDADVQSYAAALRLGLGAELVNKTLVTPYLGLVYSNSRRASYSENYQVGVVDDPFSYSAYGEERITGTMGVDVEGNINADTYYRIGAGIDHDFSSSLDAFEVSSDLFGDMAYTSDASVRDYRLFGSIGLGYVVEPNRTLTLDINGSQMDDGSDLDYSLMAGYRVAF